jgi:hypothetical protein
MNNNKKDKLDTIHYGNQLSVLLGYYVLISTTEKHLPMLRTQCYRIIPIMMLMKAKIWRHPKCLSILEHLHKPIVGPYYVIVRTN